MQIGRYWAGLDECPDASEHEALGVVLVDEYGFEVNQVFRTFQSNLPAEHLFYRCGTQWQRSPMSGELLALNYSGVESVARMAGIDVSPELFENLQAIERGALGYSLDLPELDEVEIVHIGIKGYDK